MNTKFVKEFGKVVHRLRQGRGVSQEELAFAAGIHRTYVSSIELGKVRLGLDVAKKVADGLGVPLADLVREAERNAVPESEDDKSATSALD